LANITSTLADQLENYPELLEYARDISGILNDPTGDANAKLHLLGKVNQVRNIMGVRLEIPEELALFEVSSPTDQPET
jgi:hypothetical protein